MKPVRDIPGKGLPLLERLFLRYVYMPRAYRHTSWDESHFLFQDETDHILALIEPLTAAQRATRTLIPRVKGMEDSSRFWSIDLTLEHLMIVTKGMADIIIELSKHHAFPHEIAIKNVKPRGMLDHDGVALFRSSMKTAEDYLQKHIEDRQSPTTHKHPWFGPMNAHQWHTLLALHHRIHRIQIENIIQRLN